MDTRDGMVRRTMQTRRLQHLIDDLKQELTAVGCLEYGWKDCYDQMIYEDICTDLGNRSARLMIDQKILSSQQRTFAECCLKYS